MIDFSMDGSPGWAYRGVRLVGLLKCQFPRPHHRAARHVNNHGVTVFSERPSARSALAVSGEDMAAVA